MESGQVEFDSYIDPETAFLASKQETGHEWELFKENVRPLKRGRKVELLNHALKSTTDFRIRKSLLEKRRTMIQEIDLYQGDDPLQPWIDCIKWVQESFPPGGDCSGLIVIYEQCVRTFWHDDRYKNDLRFLKVWLEYAENCHDAEVIYTFLEANEIGLTHSSFYISYALHVEKKNKMRTANEIFNRGIAMNAKPAEKLKEAYKKFLTRTMRQQNAPTEDCTENNLPVRSFGTALPGGGNQANTNSMFPRKKLKQDGSNSRVPLSIYKDTNNIDARLGHQAGTSKVDPKAWCTLGSRSERNKENNAIPSKWTANKIPVRAGHSTRGVAPPIPRIEILVDEECAKEHKVEKEEVKSSILQLRHGDHRDMKKETDMLRENPLRHFPFSSLPR